MDRMDALAADVKILVELGLPARFFDIVEGADMTDAERASSAYDYKQQAWVRADHAHTDGNESLLCGAVLHSCCPSYAAACAL